MKVVIQRVLKAAVSSCEWSEGGRVADESAVVGKDGESLVAGGVRRAIGQGFMILLGIGCDDTQEDIDYLIRKICGLRVFSDENGIMNLSISDIGGECLVVSQFTLMASTKKGNRPSYIAAAPHNISIPLYEKFLADLSTALGKEIAHGEFGADMQVSLINDGPVTIVIDSKNK